MEHPVLTSTPKMEPKLLDELADIIALPKPQALAQLQEKKHQGKLSSGDLELLITEFLSPIRIETDGHKVALHTQLARARFADDDVTTCQSNGTPPQRYSWSVADRRSEPIRRGSPEWVAAKRPVGGALARRSPLVTCLDDSDEDEEAAAAPQTKWGRVERGRTSRQRCEARLRCARGQPSSLRSSWSVAKDDDPATVASDGAEEAEDERIREPVDVVEELAGNTENRRRRSTSQSNGSKRQQTRSRGRQPMSQSQETRSRRQQTRSRSRSNRTRTQ